MRRLAMAEKVAKTAGKARMSVTLKSADGATLKVCARKDKRSTGATAFAIHSTAKNGDGKRVHTRGAITTHPTVDAAVAAMTALVETAVKAGWVRPSAPVLGS